MNSVSVQNQENFNLLYIFVYDPQQWLEVIFGFVFDKRNEIDLSIKTCEIHPAWKNYYDHGHF